MTATQKSRSVSQLRLYPLRDAHLHKGPLASSRRSQVERLMSAQVLTAHPIDCERARSRPGETAPRPLLLYSCPSDLLVHTHLSKEGVRWNRGVLPQGGEMHTPIMAHGSTLSGANTSQTLLPTLRTWACHWSIPGTPDTAGLT